MRNNLRLSETVAANVRAELGRNRISQVKAAAAIQMSAPALSKRLGDVIAGLKGSAVSVLIAQSDLNHSRKLVDAEFVIERGANVTLAAA